MYDEAGRLMRDHYWTPDMADVDWSAVLADTARWSTGSAPVTTCPSCSGRSWRARQLARVRDQRRLPVTIRAGCSATSAPTWSRVGDRWRVAGCCPGVVGAGRARPLSAPGVAVRAGDEILAVDGRPVDPPLGPGPLLAGAASRSS